MLKQKANAQQEEEPLTKKSKIKGNTPYLFNLPPQNRNFTGRKGLLAQIAQTFAQFSPQDVHPVILTACYGLGGVGKTQLALQYAYRHLHAYTAIYWINAETTEQVELAFYQLAQVLKLEAQSPQTMIPMVKQWWETHPGYLVIFDNVEDYDKIELYLPRVNGQVLITSRYTQWPDQNIAVDIFDPEEANAYIQKLLGVGTLPEAEQLAHTLGYLPLALAQACAFIKQNHITLTKYLEWYATKRAQLLQSKLLPAGDKHLPIYINWEMTLKVICDKLNHNKGEQLLTLCAYLQHIGIPKHLLSTYLADQQLVDEVEQIELLAILLNYSLLQEDKSPDCYTMHPVMQEVMKLSHNIEIKALWLKTVICQFEKLYPYGRNKLDNLRLKRQLLPHLEQVFKQLDQSSLTQEQDREKLLIRLADGYEAIGGAKQAKVYFEQALTIQEKHYGPDHPDVASTLVNLGNAYGALGDAKQQKTYLEQALAIRENRYGSDSPEVASTLVSLGIAYGVAGKTNQEKDYLEKALKIQEKRYGPTHPEVARILSNLGIAHGVLGDNEKKKAHLERSLVILEKHYEKDHPDIGRILGNLGNAYGALGDLQKRKIYLEQALKIQAKHYGPTHPEVARTLGNLGNAYGNLGDAQQQKAYLERALKIKEKYYGPNHPSFACTLVSLSSAYGNLGDAQQQEVFLKQALVIKKDYYGEDHPEVAIVFFNLSRAYFTLRKIDQAVSLVKQSHAIYQKHYGNNHRYTQQAKLCLEQYQNELVTHSFTLK